MRKIALLLLLLISSNVCAYTTYQGALDAANSYMVSAPCTGSYYCNITQETGKNGGSSSTTLSQFHLQRFQGTSNYGDMYYGYPIGDTGACQSGYQRVTPLSNCTASPITCPTGQYAPSGSTSTAQCTVIPNCNANSPQDGKFFDTSTGQCSAYTGSMTLCVSGVAGSPTKYYCAQVDDCLLATKTCSNNPVDVQAAQNARAAQVAAIKLQADARRSQADAAATQAANAAAAKQAAKTAAASAAVAAKAASDSAAASGNSTPSQIAAAADAYNKAAAESAAVSAKASNAAAASGVAGTQAGAADSADNSIPSSNPGNAGSYSDRVDGALVQALTALNDALSGLGSGTGTGQGASAGTCTDTGTCNDGTAAGVAPSDPGADSFYKPSGKTFQSVTGAAMTDISNTAVFGFVKGVFSVSVPGGSCPVWILDPGMGLGTFSIDYLCKPPMSTVWPIVSAVVIGSSVFMGIRLIFTAF